MTKLSETDEKSKALWHVVVEALLNHIEHHRDLLLAEAGPNDEWYLGAMRRSAQTLAMFVDPQRD